MLSITISEITLNQESIREIKFYLNRNQNQENNQIPSFVNSFTCTIIFFLSQIDPRLPQSGSSSPQRGIPQPGVVHFGKKIGNPTTGTIRYPSRIPNRCDLGILQGGIRQEKYPNPVGLKKMFSV
jgi:hypothetical protein